MSTARLLLRVLVTGATIALLYGLSELARSPDAMAWVDPLTYFTTIFLGIFIEAASFLLLGAVAAGLVEVFVSPEALTRFVPRHPLLGALAGSLLGLFFPVCECGVIPLARRLFAKGLPLSVGVAFLLAAPVFNPIVIASTIAAFGLGRILLLRLGLTLAIAVGTGLVFATQRHAYRLLRPLAWAPMAGASHALPLTPRRPGWRTGVARVVTITMDEFYEMGRYLVFGSLLAAAMQTVLPQAALLTVSAGPVLSVLTMTLLAVVLSICSTVDAFIALAFAPTFTTGALLAFLVFGPMVDIKSTLMYLSVFRPRPVFYLIGLPLLMTWLATVFINFNTRW